MRRGGVGHHNSRGSSGIDQAAPIDGHDRRGDAVKVLRVRQRLDRGVDAGSGQVHRVGQALAAVVRDGDDCGVGARGGGIVASHEGGGLAGGQADRQIRQVLQCEEGVAVEADAVHRERAAAGIDDGERLVVRGIQQHGAEVLVGGCDAEEGIRTQRCHMQRGLGELAGDRAHRPGIGGIVGGAVGIDVAGAVAAHSLALEVVQGTVISGVHRPVEHDHQIAPGVGIHGLQGDDDGVFPGGIIDSPVIDLCQLGGGNPAGGKIREVRAAHPDLGGHVGQVGLEIGVERDRGDVAEHTDLGRKVEGLVDAVAVKEIHGHADGLAAVADGDHNHPGRHHRDIKHPGNVIGGVLIPGQHHLATQGDGTLGGGSPGYLGLGSGAGGNGRAVDRGQHRVRGVDQLHLIGALGVAPAVIEVDCIDGGIVDAGCHITADTVGGEVISCRGQGCEGIFVAGQERYVGAVDLGKFRRARDCGGGRGRGHAQEITGHSSGEADRSRGRGPGRRAHRAIDELDIVAALIQFNLETHDVGRTVIPAHFVVLHGEYLVGSGSGQLVGHAARAGICFQVVPERAQDQNLAAETVAQ